MRGNRACHTVKAELRTVTGHLGHPTVSKTVGVLWRQLGTGFLPECTKIGNLIFLYIAQS